MTKSDCSFTQEALEESQRQLYLRLEGLLQQQHSALEKQLQQLETTLEKACDGGGNFSRFPSAPGIRLVEAPDLEGDREGLPAGASRPGADDARSATVAGHEDMDAISQASSSPAQSLQLQGRMRPADMMLLEHGSETSGFGSEISFTGRSSGEEQTPRSGEAKRVISFSEHAEIRLKTPDASPGPASMDPTQVSRPVNRPSLDLLEDVHKSGSAGSESRGIRRSKTSEREFQEMKEQLQMAKMRRTSTRISAIIKDKEDIWSRGISVSSAGVARTSSEGKAAHSLQPKRKNERKKTQFAHEGDERQAMKERARNLAATRSMEGGEEAFQGPSMSPWERFQLRLRLAVGSPGFEAFVGCLVAFNAVIIGLEVEYLSVNYALVSPVWYQTLHFLFAVLFTLELLVRFVAYDVRLYTDSDMFRWALFDVIIVASSWIDIAASSAALEESSTTGLAPVRVVRVLRITRLIRVTRLAKLMMWLKALRTLIHSVFVTLKSLVWAMVLLALIMYVLPKEEWSEQDLALHHFWGSLGDAVSTLFMSITGGISWQIAELPLCQLSLAWKVVYFLYIAFTIFAVLNVMTGVFCQSAIESAARDHDMVMQNVMQEKDGHLRKCRQLFAMLDLDGTGCITIIELEKRLEDPQVQVFFEALELSIDDVWTFFMLLDGDAGQEIDMEEFLFGCMRLRGDAKALELAKLMQSHAWMAKKQVDFMMFCEEQFAQLPHLIRGYCKPRAQKLAAPSARSAHV